MGRVKRSGVGGGEREEYFFSPPPPLFPSFALAPTLRVTVFALPNLPPHNKDSGYNKAAFTRPKYACTEDFRKVCVSRSPRISS